jgi:DNA polymerase-1
MSGWNIDLPGTLYFDLATVQNQPDEADKFQAFMNEMAAQQVIAIDTETTGLVSWKDVPLYWSVAWEGKRATLNANTLATCRPIFDRTDIDWVFANAKYDAHILGNVGIEFAGRLIDTCVEHALLYEDKPHGLKYVVKHLLGWAYGDFQDQFGKIGKKQSAEENFQLLIEYASNDAWATWGAHKELRRQLEGAVTHSLFRTMFPFIETLWDLFDKVEVDYTKVLFGMERHGIKVDRAALDKAEPEARGEIQDVEKEIAKLAGFVLNPKSTQQLRKYFIEQEGLKPIRWSKGGKTGARNPSVDATFLEHYKNEHPMAKLVLRHRELAKLHGTYITGLRDLLDPNDRIHTRFNQDVARTGRLSSSGPNLQNIPRPENDKWKLRSSFIPEPGMDIIAVDYEQLEMRLLAAAAMEPKMMQIFADGKDIHTGNVEMVYGIAYADVVGARKIDKLVKQGKLPETDLLPSVLKAIKARNDIKAVGFGLNYGMGANKLARQLGITTQEAKDLIERYMDTYPAVGQFFKNAVEETDRTGYAFTVLGRRRNIPQIRSSRKDERALGERLATNTQIQGSAADVCKMAQINLWKVGLEQRYGCRQLLQIHDEVVFECPKESVAEALADLMEHPFSQDLSVHLAVDSGHGASWGAAK